MESKDYYAGNMYQSINAEFVDFQDVHDLGRPPDQLTKVIKAEEYNSLSQESKEVISLIINAPLEISELISTPKGARSKNLLIKYLQKRWRSNFLVNSVIQEITEFVNSL